MGDSSYKGISATQDSRFTNKETTLLRKLAPTFPPHFSTRVDMTKVQLSVLKPWISRRVTELLGFEDEVVLEYVSQMLEDSRYPDAKKMQVQLMGFLEGKTGEFMSELWELLVSAQESVGGVPKKFVEEKKEELRRKREEGERVVREARERAQRAADGGGGAGQDGGKRRSRWDAGAPSQAVKAEEGDRRPPAYGAGREREDYRRRDDGWGSSSRGGGGSFRERNGNTTDRSRDAGWGSRAGPSRGDSWRPSSSRRSPSPERSRRRSPSPPARRRSPSPSRRRRSPSPERPRRPSPPPSRRRQSPLPERSRRPSPPSRRRRSPSPPPPPRRRSPSPPSRSESHRSRSVTPDYRAQILSKKKKLLAADEVTLARLREEVDRRYETTHPLARDNCKAQPSGPKFLDLDLPSSKSESEDDRGTKGGSSSEDAGPPRPKFLDLDLPSSDDSEGQDDRGTNGGSSSYDSEETEGERERERELRERLKKAKQSSTSGRR